MTDIATLGLRVDASGVITAEDALNRLTSAAGKAQAAATGVAAGSAQVSTQTRAMAQAAQQATTQQSALAAQMQRTQQVQQAATLSTKQYQQAMRLLPAQITDIVTSLVSGQPAYLVAIQQGGQLKDSFGGIGAAGKALLSVITPMSLILAGLAATAGAVAYGFIQGERESQGLARSLILTGNAAGTTAGQLSTIASSLDELEGVTQSGAASAISALVATAKVGGDDLERFAATVVTASRTLGMETEDIVASFADLGKRPVEASLKLNESMNYLTATTYRQIQALVEQGRETEAAKLAQDAFADALDSQTAQMEGQLGALQRGWLAIKGAIGEAKDALLDIGRVDSIEEELAALQEKRGTRELGTGQGARGAGAGFARSDARERQLTQLVEIQNRLNAADETNVRIQREAIAASRENQKWADASLTTQEKLNKALETYRRNVERARAGGIGPDAAQQAREEAAIIASFADNTSAREIEQAIESLERLNQQISGQVSTFGQAESEALAYRLTMGDLADDVERAGTQGRALADSIMEQARALDELNAAEARRKEGRQFAERVVSSERPPSVQSLVSSIGKADPDQLQSSIQHALDLENERYAQQLASLEKYQADDMAMREKYQEAIQSAERQHQGALNEIENAGVAARADASRALAEYQIANQQQMLSIISEGLGVIAAAAGESQGVQIALLLAQRGIAIAQIAIATEVAAMRALADLGPIAGAGVAAGIRGLGLASAAVVGAQTGVELANISGGRQYGGTVSAGKIYDFAEAGDPELIKIGNRVLLGMGNRDGQVIPARAMSSAGGGMPSVTFIDQSSGVRADWRMSDGEIIAIIEDRDQQTQERAVQQSRAAAIGDVTYRRGLGRAIENRNGLRPRPMRGMN